MEETGRERRSAEPAARRIMQQQRREGGGSAGGPKREICLEASDRWESDEVAKGEGGEKRKF